MKRSEMLDILSEAILSKWDLPWNEFGMKPEDALYEFANDVLTSLEDSGMRSPLLLDQEYKGPLEGWEPE